MDIREFVALQNIRRFKQRLSEERDPSVRAELQALCAQYTEDLERARAEKLGGSVSQSRGVAPA